MGKSSGRIDLRRHEADDIEDVATAVGNFNCSAPVGTYSLDNVISRLERRLVVSHYESPHEFLRTLIKGAVASSWGKIYFGQKRSFYSHKAQDFLSLLQRVWTSSDQLAKTIAAEHEHLIWFCHMFEIKRSFVDEAEEMEREDREIEQYKEAEFILEKTQQLSHLMRVCAVSAHEYLNAIRLADFKLKEPGNRAVPFTFFLIQEVSEAWRTAFGAPAQRVDVADMTEEALGKPYSVIRLTSARRA